MTALVPLDADAVERAADPAEFVVLACERAKSWLAQALDHGDLDGLVETKAQAEVIRVFTVQKELGRDAQLAAAEIVRRAERGIGVAIRRGQEAGEIRKRGRHAIPVVNRNCVSPEQFATTSELSGNDAGIYHMTDGVSDDEFEAAIAEAKAEGNLTRANLVRKVRGQPAQKDRWQTAAELAARGATVDQIADAIGITGHYHIRTQLAARGVDIPADITRNTQRRIDSDRIVASTVDTLDGLTQGLRYVDYAELDHDQIDGWVTSLDRSLRSLNRLRKRLKEATRG